MGVGMGMERSESDDIRRSGKDQPSLLPSSPPCPWASRGDPSTGRHKDGCAACALSIAALRPWLVVRLQGGVDLVVGSAYRL